MKGDYHRYLAEFATGDRRGKSSEESLAAYKSASEIAASNLGSLCLYVSLSSCLLARERTAPTHPIRKSRSLLSIDFVSNFVSQVSVLH